MFLNCKLTINTAELPISKLYIYLLKYLISVSIITNCWFIHSKQIKEMYHKNLFENGGEQIISSDGQ